MNGIRSFFASLIVVGFVSSNAQARLGETREQLKARYGNPTAVPMPGLGSNTNIVGAELGEGGLSCLVYEKDPYRIQCFFRDEFACTVQYFKSGFGEESKFTETEVEAILQKNSPGFWDCVVSEDPRRKVWHQDSTKRTAICVLDPEDLTIKKLAITEDSEIKRALNKKVDGL